MFIHQMLFGYKNGHQLLASSTKNFSNYIDVLTRLSDLSGSMPINSEFKPYLTCYPLSDKKFYVVSKTWMDNNSSRSGCVLTHTLLIPINDWKENNNIFALKKILKQPESINDIEPYKKDIFISDEKTTLTPTTKLQIIEYETHSEFVFRFFSEGITPIVIFSEKNMEDAFWQYAYLFWPDLRANFSCCTFSLQPRYINDKIFMLMFAPISSYSRFSNIPRENIIEKSNLFFSFGNNKKEEEPWIREWSNYLYIYSNSYDKSNFPNFLELDELGKFLQTNPTQIKKLFLVKELRKRSSFSAMASVGLIDLIESIVPEESTAIKYKEDTLLFSFHSIKNSNKCNENIKCLVLINDRLQHDAYQRINVNIIEEYCLLVSEYVFSNPVLSITSAEGIFESQSKFHSSPYSCGLKKGLLLLAKSQPSKLSILEQFPEATPLIISLEPLIGKYYLRSCGENSPAIKKDVIQNLNEWITKIDNKNSYILLRQVLLPDITDSTMTNLANTLLRNVQEDEVFWILNTISKSTDDLKIKEINETIIANVCSVFPDKTLEWAIDTKDWSFEKAKLVAFTFQLSPDGLYSILDITDISIVKKSQILAAFIIRTIQNNQLPYWFHEIAKKDTRVILNLFLTDELISDEVLNTIMIITTQVSILPIVDAFTLKNFIAFNSTINQSHKKNLKSIVARSIAVYYLQGNIDWDNFKNWEAFSLDSHGQITISEKEILEIILDYCPQNIATWKRGWNWLSEISKTNKLDQLPKIINYLISMHGGQWDLELTYYWENILNNAKNKLNYNIYLQLCVDAISFSFTHTQDPVSILVIQTFLPIYSVVFEANEFSPETYKLFGFFEWDKCKELRKKIIFAFTNSNWPPGDLIIALKDKNLIRKIYSRLLRIYNGKDYINKILENLHERMNEPNVPEYFNFLTSLTNQEYFHEPWD